MTKCKCNVNVHLWVCVLNISGTGVIRGVITGKRGVGIRFGKPHGFSTIAVCTVLEMTSNSRHHGQSFHGWSAITIHFDQQDISN